jgi:hypothetical protein
LFSSSGGLKAVFTEGGERKKKKPFRIDLSSQQAAHFYETLVVVWLAFNLLL